MLRALRSLIKDENGQAMVEYGIIIGLIAVVVIVVLTGMGDQLKALFEKITGKLPPVGP